MNVLITGGASGIGLALSQLYLSQGHRVGIIDCNFSPLEDPSPFICFEVDVTDKKEMRKAILDFSKEGLDLLITSAGIATKSWDNIPDFEHTQKMMETNYFGMLNSFGPAIDFMKNNNQGHLVAISSSTSKVGLPFRGGYCASKAAIDIFCESLRHDLRPLNINVTTLAPGFVKTPMTKDITYKKCCEMSAEKAAHIISKAISKKKTHVIFPLSTRITSLFLILIPRKLYDFMIKGWGEKSRKF